MGKEVIVAPGEARLKPSLGTVSGPHFKDDADNFEREKKQMVFNL